MLTLASLHDPKKKIIADGIFGFLSLFLDNLPRSKTKKIENFEF